MKGLISYDICRGKKRIDVKSFDHPSNGMRLSIEGKRAIKSFVRGIEDVIDESDDLINSFMTDAEDKRARDAGVDMDLVRYFLTKRSHTSDCGEMPKGFIFGGTKKYPFGVAQLIREVRNIVKIVPRAKRIIKHKMFADPSMLKRQFSDKMIEDVFCRCDAVAFVNDELGYLEVPSRDVKKYVSPARITQGTLSLEFKIR